MDVVTDNHVTENDAPEIGNDNAKSEVVGELGKVATSTGAVLQSDGDVVQPVQEVVIDVVQPVQDVVVDESLENDTHLDVPHLEHLEAGEERTSDDINASVEQKTVSDRPVADHQDHHQEEEPLNNAPRQNGAGEDQQEEKVNHFEEHQLSVEDNQIGEEREQESINDDDEQERDESETESQSYDMHGVTQDLPTLDNRVDSEHDDDDGESEAVVVAVSDVTSHPEYHNGYDADDRVAHDVSGHDSRLVEEEEHTETPEVVEQTHENERHVIEHVTQTLSSPPVAPSDTPVALSQPDKPIPIPARRADKVSAPSPTAAPVVQPQRNPNVSGKFVMRSSSKPDVNSFINIIRQSKSADDAAGSDELLTVIRNSLVRLENKTQDERKSVVKEVFVQAYEKNVISNLTSPTSPSAASPIGISATKPLVEPKNRPIPETVEEVPVQKVTEQKIAGLKEERVKQDSVLSSSTDAAPHPTSQVSTDQLQSPNESPAKRAAEPVSVAPAAAAAAAVVSPERTVVPAAEITARTNDVTPKPESSPATASQAATPQWKADIDARKNLKSFTLSQKPEQPFRLGTVPEWKKQLSEKAKLKKDQSQSGSDDGTPSPLSLSGGTTSSDTPWKLELAQLKKLAVLSPEAKSQQEIPEWLRIAEEKQKKLAAPATNGNK